MRKKFRATIRFYNLLKNIIHTLLAKQTIGVRMLLINEEKVLLVKHTYQQGWYTIGGGVKSGETPSQAMTRELKEETGITLTSPLELFSTYYSRNEKRDDYIIFYIGRGAGIQENTTSFEIAATQWFTLHDLPQDTSPATRRRIQEYLKEIDIKEHW